MYRKLILALPLVLAAMLALSGTARAACPIDDPDCGGGGGPITVTKTLRVVDSSQATLTATGINCGVGGDDCTESYSYTTDEEPPTVTLTAGGVPAGYTAHVYKCLSSTAASCSGTETQCGVGSCTLDMNANYRVRLAVTDDTAPSQATITGPSKAGPSVRHFTASATDGAGVVSYHFWLDGVDQGLFSPGAGYDVPTSLSEGSHTLTARARDAAGNESVSPSADKTFIFDHSANVTVTGGPANGGHYRTVPSLTFTHDSDAAPDGITCQTLKGASVVDSSACTGTYVPVTSSDGDYVVKVQFADDVGNQTTAQRSFTVDTGDPNVDITSPTAGQHVKTGFTPAYTAHDGGTSDANLAVSCKLDAGAYSDCGPLTLADGSHTLSVKATDEAGNTREVSRDFVADSSGPHVTINSGPANDSIITSSTATYGWSSTDASAPLSQTCKLDGGAASACSSPKSYAGLSEGSHTFTLRVADALGNATEVSREVFVNAVRPSVVITSGPSEGAVIRSTSVTIGFKPAGGGAVSCSLDSETAYRPCSGASSDSLNGLADGAHIFRVRVKDQSDDTAVASRTFRVDTSVPPPPITQIVKKILNPSLSSRFDRFPKYTVYKKLLLKRVPAGSTITVKCKGKKCPAKRFRKKAHGSVKLSKFMKKHLRPGTKLTIRVTKPHFIGKQFVILIRKSKAPKLTIRQIA